MKYELWSEDNLDEIRRETRFKDKATKMLTEQIIDLLREANHRHEKEMLGKDAEVAELKGALKTFQFMAKELNNANEKTADQQ